MARSTSTNGPAPLLWYVGGEEKSHVEGGRGGTMLLPGVTGRTRKARVVGHPPLPASSSSQTSHTADAGPMG